MKCGGQYLHYVQQRFYAGNNGLLGLFGYGGAFTGFAVLRFPARSGVEQGAWQPVGCLDAPPQPRRALRAGRLQVHAGADAQPRHALGLHAAGRREGQPSVEFRPEYRPGRSSRRTATARAGRFTRRTRRASSRGSGSPTVPASGGSSVADTGSPSTWRAPAPTCGCRSTRRTSSNRRCRTTRPLVQAR